VNGDAAATLIAAAGLRPEQRAEELGLAQFAALADSLHAAGFTATKDQGGTPFV
jgi:16S rRNA A1518/A1519 N6-dimethyltransferase RsmA/KsgA/DIM1 with predicted DNA glycosylase/AP lyase activity